MIEKVSWGGWPNCYRITDGKTEAIVTTDVGPRIVRYGFVGGQNLLLEIPAEQGGQGEDRFVARGGHRLWIAPEHREGTYAADNQPCEAVVDKDTLQLTSPKETFWGLQKQLHITLMPDGRLQILHRVSNRQPVPIIISIWALTMMAPNGFGITGFPPRGTHPEQLAPTNPLVMWAFTNLRDPRLQFTMKHLVLRQDPSCNEPNKLGIFNVDTWGAYLLQNDLFIKRATADANAAYPDFGSSFEIWTNGQTLELETLSPLKQLAPSEALEHQEIWSLKRVTAITQFSDESIAGLLE